MRHNPMNGGRTFEIAVIEQLEPRALFSAVTAFVLVNADTDQDIGTIHQGDVYFLSDLPAHINVRADTSPAVVGSLQFNLDGTYIHTENTAPYALFGNNGNDYTNGTIGVGNHTLAGTPFSGANASGT